MKALMKTAVYTFVVCFVCAVGFAATDPQMGTWKLNEEKSKIAAGAPKNDTVIYEAAGDSIKVTLESNAPDGSKVHTEWTGKFDGKDYPSTGNPNETTRSYKRVNAHTMTVDSKKDGKTVLSGSVVVSADGKSRTVTVTSTDAQGKKAKSVAVYDKQ
jgi:hypothetical protein